MISYQLPVAERVVLRVYNTAGQLVRTLVNDRQDAGAHTATWDGLNDSGSAVSGGVYFYTLESGANKATKRMVLMK